MDTLEENNEGWSKYDQFEVNARKFGTKSTYKEEIYTNKLNLEKLTEEQKRKGEKLSREIEKE